ncbi:MAG: hypothetical protein HY959_14005 [Ignavibacteriae bacterium]|nr:hypothetical protein [Ignavibacteriota bacterium]
MKIFLTILALFALAAIISSCDGIFPTAPRDALLPDHTRNLKGIMHKETGKEIEFDDCMECHTDNIKGMSVKINGVYRWTPSCIQCHGRNWEEKDDTRSKRLN